MTKTFILFFYLLVAVNFSVVAQNVIFDLPIVGDTIDHDEKVKYVLFEEIPKSDYLFSIISQKNTDTIITHYRRSDTVEVKTSLQNVNAMLYNINKLNNYYNSIASNSENNSTDYSKILNPNAKTIYPVTQNRIDSLLIAKPIANAEIKKKARRQYWGGGRWDLNSPALPDRRTEKEKMLGDVTHPNVTSPSVTPKYTPTLH